MIYIDTKTGFIGIPRSSVGSVFAKKEMGSITVAMRISDGTCLTLCKTLRTNEAKILVERIIEAIEQGKNMYICPHVFYSIGTEKHMFH